MGVYQAKENNEMEADGTLSKHAQQKKNGEGNTKRDWATRLALGKIFSSLFSRIKVLDYIFAKE